jgi:hypothetical protein
MQGRVMGSLVSTGYGICRWGGRWGERENTSWEEKALILGWIDERKGITGLGEWQREKAGRGISLRGRGRGRVSGVDLD